MLNENKRLLLELEVQLREINRRTINAAIPELTPADLQPVLTLVARVRARYLHALFEIAGNAGDGLPSDEDIERLAELRRNYEELVHATQALETAIEREYLDVRVPVVHKK